jgi:DNA-binding LacI/PurR family transcriptional regulator
MQGKLTIQDIAQAAGLSKAIVPRVVSNNPSVAPHLAERVISIVHENHFTPNITATGLARGCTDLISVLTFSPARPASLRLCMVGFDNNTVSAHVRPSLTL